MRVEVLAVGRELLIGKTLNTNAHWIGRRLALMGTMIKEMTTCDDDPAEIPAALKSSLSRKPDFLVVIGGLGPTPDDMTLEGIAKGLGRRMKQSDEALELVRAHYEAIGMSDIEITPARRKMTVLPEGATPLPNEEGTAPGVRIVAGDTVVFCLPGVPGEMRGIFRRSVGPEIREKTGRLFRGEVVIKIEGVYESAMAPLIKKELQRNPGVYIKSHPRGARNGVSKIELDIAAVSNEQRTAESVAARIGSEMRKELEMMGGRIRSVKP